MFETYGIQACLISLKKVALKYDKFLKANGWIIYFILSSKLVNLEFIQKQIKHVIESLTHHLRLNGVLFQSKVFGIKDFLERHLTFLDDKDVIKV